jgi:hypothetical protein
MMPPDHGRPITITPVHVADLLAEGELISRVEAGPRRPAAIRRSSDASS